MPAPMMNGNVKTRAESNPPPREERRTRPYSGNERLTPGQKTLIWTIVRKNGIEEEMFRDWLEKEYKTRSTKELTQVEAAETIRCLKRFIGEEYEPHMKGLTWGITRAQMRNVKRLAAEIGWKEPDGRADERRIGGMVRKMFPPKNRLELCNKTEGTALIIALEKMGNDRHKGTEAEGIEEEPEDVRA